MDTAQPVNNNSDTIDKLIETVIALANELYTCSACHRAISDLLDAETSDNASEDVLISLLLSTLPEVHMTLRAIANGMGVPHVDIVRAVGAANFAEIVNISRRLGEASKALIDAFDSATAAATVATQPHAQASETPAPG